LGGWGRTPDFFGKEDPGDDVDWTQEHGSWWDGNVNEHHEEKDHGNGVWTMNDDEDDDGTRKRVENDVDVG
jgi:hypothetical protein